MVSSFFFYSWRGVLGLVLLILYSSHLTDLMHNHSVSYEMLADDILFHNSAPPENYDYVVHTVQNL